MFDDEKFFPELPQEPEPEETPEEDTEQETPEAEDETPAEDTAQEEQQEEAEGEKEGDDKKPSLIFGKYKSIEEAERGYKELEKAFGKKSTEAARLRKQVDATPRKAPAEEDKPKPRKIDELRGMEPDKWLALLGKGPGPVLDAIEEALREETKPLKERVATNTYQEQVRQFSERHDDIDEYAEEMAEWLKEHPKLAKEPDALEMAYKAAKYDRLMETLPAIGGTDEADKAKAKAAKNVARMPSPAPAKKQPSVEEAALAAILDEDKRARGSIFG